MNTRQILIFFNLSKAVRLISLIIYVFCKNCEPETEPEIVFVLIFVTKTLSGSHSGSQLLQNA